jgi:hypothetical protein
MHAVGSWTLRAAGQYSSELEICQRFETCDITGTSWNSEQTSDN